MDDVMTKSLSSCGDVEDCSNAVAAGAILSADDENYMSLYNLHGFQRDDNAKLLDLHGFPPLDIACTKLMSNSFGAFHEAWRGTDELWELGGLPLDHTFSGFMTSPDESIDGGHADHSIMMSSPDHEQPPYCADLIGSDQLHCEYMDIEENCWIPDQSTTATCDAAIRNLMEADYLEDPARLCTTTAAPARGTDILYADRMSGGTWTQKQHNEVFIRDRSTTTCSVVPVQVPADADAAVLRRLARVRLGHSHSELRDWVPCAEGAVSIPESMRLVEEHKEVVSFDMLFNRDDQTANGDNTCLYDVTQVSQSLQAAEQPRHESCEQSRMSIEPCVDQPTPEKEFGMTRSAHVHGSTKSHRKKLIGVTKHRTSERFEAHVWNDLDKSTNRCGKQGHYVSRIEAARIHDLSALKLGIPSRRPYAINFPADLYHEDLEEMKDVPWKDYLWILKSSKKHSKWEARVGYNKTPSSKSDLYLGIYVDKIVAAHAHDLAALHFHKGKRHCKTNFHPASYPREAIDMFMQSVQKGDFTVPFLDKMPSYKLSFKCLQQPLSIT
ncbi:unnamed protein product [Sphagnum jensenii]|uniref:AP2/ERF domain-containing protein n=2 Tax=Sphagnum jensenii TaxID=128206 RepID=A0ABP1AU86_9BRYO